MSVKESTFDLGCPWLEEGLYIDTKTYKDFDDPVSGNLGVRSCCRIGQLPKKFSLLQPRPDDLGHKYEQLQVNRKDPAYNFENLKDNACARCHNDEQVHGESVRTRIRKLKNTNLTTSSERKTRFLQFTFSNFCNLKCKYCGPGNSSSWNEDVDISEGLFRVYMDKTETLSMEDRMLELIKKLDLSELKSVGIFGGEPFMARKFPELMETIYKKANPGRIYFWLNTNGSIFPKPRIIEMLSEFAVADIRLSNESVGNLSEYIRNGLDWEQFDRNTDKWLEASVGTGIDLKVHAAHNVWSVNKVEEFYNWVKSKGAIVHNSETYQPLYSNVSAVLNKEQLKECYDQLESMPDSSIKKYVQRMLSTDRMQGKHEDALKQFRNFVRIFDQRTPYTLKEVNPQLFDWTHG